MGSLIIDTINSRIKEFENIETRVGWSAAPRYQDGTPVAYVAALNEFGHGRTPPRPFIRPTIAEKSRQWIDMMTSLAKKVVHGDITAIQAMDALGGIAKADVQETISNVFSPALSPITIELRAMKMRNPNLQVTGATVGEAARRVASPDYSPPSGVSTKPLEDTGYMRRTITSETVTV